jgi:ABC-type multidrug transport system fused ATPase/permease subunit
MQSVVAKLMRLVEPGHRRRLVWIVALMAVTAAFQTAGVASIMPFLAVLADPSMVESNSALRALYKALSFQSVAEFLFFLGVAAFVLFATGTALQAGSHWIVTRFSHGQQYLLSRRLMSDYLSRPYSFFLSRNSGDLAKTVLQETRQAVSGALLPAMRLVGFTLLAVAVTALLIAAHPKLAIGVAVAIGASYACLDRFSRKWLARIGKDRVAANQARFTASAEAFAGAKEIRLLGREQQYLERYREPSQRFARHQANAALLASLPIYAMETIAFGGVLLVSLYLMSSENGIASALPTIGLYGLAGRQLIPAVNKIFQAVAEIRFNLSAVDSVLADLGHRAGSRKLAALGTQEPLEPHDAIHIESLCYRYPEVDALALDSINVVIKANSTIGIIGSSGAGKSTFVDLFLGLLDPTSGHILIDDTCLDADSVPRWQANIGYVPQHIFLADQSVSQNIALGVSEDQIDQRAVERAARMANLHGFVVGELSDGYSTVIGERGVRLSGGQRQRGRYCARAVSRPFRSGF